MKLQILASELYKKITNQILNSPQHLSGLK